MNNNNFIIVNTQRKALDPIRTPKLSSRRYGSYRGGGPGIFLIYKYKYINFINK